MATILIVDDHSINLGVLTALLSHFGHTLVEARDGAEALEQAKKFHPDLVISDMLMPNMDGVEFVKWMRETPAIANTPVIFYTASYRMREARSLAASCGVEYVLSKPSQPDEILKTVSAALNIPIPQLPTPRLALNPVSTADAGRTGMSNPATVSSLDECMLALRELNASMNLVLERGLKLVESGGELHRLGGDYESAMYSLGAVSMRMTLLVELGMDLARERDGDKLLGLFTRAVQDILSSRYAGTFLFGEKQGVEKGRYLKGLEPEIEAALGPADYTVGVFRQVLQDRRVRQFSGDGVVALKTGLPAGHPPVKTLIVAPIIAGNQVLGVFYVANRLGTGRYDLNDELIAATLANQFGFAHANLSLYAQLSERGKQLEVLVEEKTRAQAQLRELNNDLERRVQRRTQELKEANDELEAFVGAVSHDLRNPVWAMETLSEQMTDVARKDINPKTRDEIRSIHKVAVDMRELISDLLALAHASGVTPDIEQFDLKPLLQELISGHHAETKARGIEWHLRDLPSLYCDPALLRIALHNLLSNAVKFTGKCKRPKIEIGSEAGESGEAVLYVRDNGAGFDPDNADKLFGVFQRLHTQKEFAGNGIGLATVARIMKKHGGRVWGEGKPGKGASFHLAFLCDPPRPTYTNLSRKSSGNLPKLS